MLEEVEHVSQLRGEPFRRWFSDETFDLIVWYGSDDGVTGFQLCYRDGSDHKALTWQQDHGVSHKRIDDGEGRPGRYKMTPVLVPDGVFQRDQILALFENESAQIDPEIVRIVTETMRRYAREQGSG